MIFFYNYINYFYPFHSIAPERIFVNFIRLIFVTLIIFQSNIYFEEDSYTYIV